MPTTAKPGTSPAPAPEPGLAARAAAGDGAAFEMLMRRHNQLAFRTTRAILKNDAEAEDAVQEGWLKVWRALGGWRGESRFTTWLVRVMANEALGRLRRTKAQVIPLEVAMGSRDRTTQEALSEAPHRSPEAELARAQTRRLIETRIDLLPDIYRSVFMLRAVEEMSAGDVAEALGIPEATVRSRLFRARALLREGLAGEMDHALDEAFSFDGARCDRITARVLARGRAEGLSRDP